MEIVESFKVEKKDIIPGALEDFIKITFKTNSYEEALYISPEKTKSLIESLSNMVYS